MQTTHTSFPHLPGRIVTISQYVGHCPTNELAGDTGKFCKRLRPCCGTPLCRVCVPIVKFTFMFWYIIWTVFGLVLVALHIFLEALE